MKMKLMNVKEISKFEIYYVLHSRLKTHNRIVKLFNKNIYYMPSLYWRLFKDYKRNYSNEILSIQILNTIFHYEKENKNERIEFTKIDRFFINIDTKEFVIEVNNQKYFVLTPIKNIKYNIQIFEKLILSDDAFRIATIDHNPTFKLFIEENLKQIPLTVEISKHLNPNKSTAKKIDAALRKKAENYIEIKQISLNILWTELEFLATNQKLEVVHEKYNNK